MCGSHVPEWSVCCVHSYDIHFAMYYITCMLLQKGRSALSMAVYNGHEDLAHVLLAEGADIKITNNVSKYMMLTLSKVSCVYLHAVIVL